MLIKYNKANVYCFPVAAGKNVVIKPGVNNIKDEDFEAAKRLQGFKKKMSVGIIEVVEATNAGGAEAAKSEVDAEPAKAASITDIGVKEAVALVAQTFDDALLMDWREVDTRKTVQDAIDKQLAKIEVKKSEDSGDDE